MKTCALTFALTSLLITSTLGQQLSDTDSLKRTFYQYRAALNEHDIEKELDFTYPPLFNYLSKYAIRFSLEQIYSDSALNNISTQVDSLDSISSIIELKRNKYALIKYKKTVTMNLQDIRERGGQMAVNMILALLNEQLGEENVNFDSTSYTVKITKNVEAYCILNPRYEGWKFLLNSHPEMKPYIREILPAKILKRLN